MTLQDLEYFARRDPEHSGYIGQIEIGEGKYKTVTKGTYESGTPAADKFLKTGVTFSSNCFEDDKIAAEAALPYVAGFHNYIENETAYRGRVSIKVNVPQVWTQSSGRLEGQKMLREPYINNFKKFNSNSGAADSTAAVAQALSHYSYHASDGNELLCDLQGGKVGESYVLSDVVVMSKSKKYGNTDLGVTGIENWLNCHRCTQFCSSEWKNWSGARRLFEPVFSTTTTLEAATAPRSFQDLVRVRPSAIHFTHDTVKNHFQDGHTLLETALQIAREEVGKRDIRMINVVRASGGRLYALDNRRLAVFRLLEICGKVGTIKVEIVPVSNCSEEWNRKTTTSNGGVSISVRGGYCRIGKASHDTNFPDMHQIRNAYPNREILSDEHFSIFLGGFTDN